MKGTKNPKIPGGYVLLPREISTMELFKNKPATYFKTYIYILMKATHTKSGNLERGTCRVTIDEIRDVLSYYKGAVLIKPSRKEVFGILEWLRTPHPKRDDSTKVTLKVTLISTTKVTQGMLCKVHGYSVSQDPSSYEGNRKTAPEGNGQGNNKNKNDIKKEINKEKNPLIPSWDDVLEADMKRAEDKYGKTTS